MSVTGATLSLPVYLSVHLALLAATVAAAPINGHHEQEINLKLRILVPRNSQHGVQMRPAMPHQVILPRPSVQRGALPHQALLMSSPGIPSMPHAMHPHLVSSVSSGHPGVSSLSHTSMPFVSPMSSGHPGVSSLSHSTLPLISAVSSGQSGVSSMSHATVPHIMSSVSAGHPGVSSVSHTTLPLVSSAHQTAVPHNSLPILSPVPAGHLLPPAMSSVSHTTVPLMSSVPGYAVPSYTVSGRPVNYRTVPVRTVYTYGPPVYMHQYNAWSRPLLHTSLQTGTYGLRYNYSGLGLPNKHINITMGLDNGAGGKVCECNKTSQDTKDDEDELLGDTDGNDDAEELPETSPNPVKNLWAGYVPEDLLQHAKKTLINGKVKVEKNLNKVKVKHKWQNSNYPKQKLPGVGEDLWNAIKEDLKDLTNKGNTADLEEDHDPDFEEPKNNRFEDGHHADDYEVRQDDDGRPFFVDFWGNRVPKYNNDFKATAETIRESESEYNKDPHGWNPEYTKGLWTADDNHLQVFSGHQQLPTDAKATYDNGLGEGLEKNYNRYVADNGTWVGPKPDPIDDDLGHLLKDAVSREPALENPHDTHKTYADVIRYLNSKKYPQPSSTTPEPQRHQPEESRKSVQDKNLVDVNQLLEAVIFHKQQQARKEAAAKAPGTVQPIKEEEEYEDDGEDEDEEVVVGEIPTGPTNSPDGPGSVCKGIRDVGLTEQKDGTQMAHVQGVVCVNNYDYTANKGEVDAEAEKGSS